MSENNPHEEQWYKDTCHELSNYLVNKKKMEIIEMKLTQQSMPSVKMCSTYGERQFGFDNDTTKEKLLAQLQVVCKSIEIALECLNKLERKIIEYKYFDEYKDNQIIKELFIGNRNTYFITKDNAIKKIARCFGKIDTDLIQS